MAAYRQVYDLRHLQADYQELVISSGTLLSVIEYGLPLLFLPMAVALFSGGIAMRYVLPKSGHDFGQSWS